MEFRQVAPATLLLSFLAYMGVMFSDITGQLKTVELEIQAGKIIGAKKASRSGRPYSEFRGIPYAQAPVGELRFEPPRPLERWKKPLWDATRDGPFCLQYDLLTHVLLGDEACLFLNVATPNTLSKPTSLFPVVVYFYGGAFMSGYSVVYSPAYFMDEDIVVVVINYRVGLFGFLNTGDDVVRGNMGLKDQNMALKWVQQNIAYFGGDPDRVTLMGQSAGGSSSHYHMLSPMSKGLFHRAISQSGNALNYFSFTKDPLKQALRLGRSMNCPTNNSRHMVACLKNKPALELNQANNKYLDFIEGRHEMFRPSAEAVNDNDTFLADEPHKLIMEGKVANVPWIVGANTNEALLFIILILHSYSSKIEELNTNWKNYGPMLLNYEDHPNRENITKILKDTLLGNKRFDWETVNVTGAILTDRLFNEGIYDSVRLQANYSTIYAYQFAYRGEFSFANVVWQMTSRLPKLLAMTYSLGKRWVARNLHLGREEEPGLEGCHLDEIPMFFHLPFLSYQIDPWSKDYPMSAALIKMWTAFARDGKPSKLFGVDWTPVPKNAKEDPGSIRYLKLDVDAAMIPEPFTSSVEFLKSLDLDNQVALPRVPADQKP